MGLPPKSPYSPQVLGWLVRLGATLPFAQAATLLAELTGVQVSATTVRRHTEALGATAVALAEQAVARLEQEAPTPPVTPARLVLGADGAMVPLLDGEWGEVKLVSVGEPVLQRGHVRTQAPSYFARLADAETFGRAALGELHRRGVEVAGTVAAVQDGASWLQGFVDYHRPDARRILDWAHAAQHLTGLAEALFGQDTARAQRAATRLRAWLWQEGPARLLAVLDGWGRACPDRPDVVRAVAYFRERRAQLDYPAFRAAGWPTGSGATESAHKQVMQARMKQAGMRWARAHVNPVLALRLLERNDRWASEGPILLRQHRCCSRAQQRSRSQARRCDRLARPARAPVACGRVIRPAAASPEPLPVPALQPLRQPASPAQHPWRRFGPWLSIKI